MNLGKIFQKQSVIPWKEIEQTRKELETLGWMTQVYDGKNPVYNGTRLGYMSYYIILDTIGLDSVANGIKVSKELLEEARKWAVLQFGDNVITTEKDILAKALEAGGIVTITYDEKDNKESWALTPYGALLLRVFFYSKGKQVGRPPTDWGTEFPKYMLKVFKFMSQISDMMNGMNANMNGKSKDPFGQKKMNSVGGFQFGKKGKGNSYENMFGGGDEPKEKKKKKAKRRKKPKYTKTNTQKKREANERTRKEPQDEYSFGDKNAKYW